MSKTFGEFLDNSEPSEEPKAPEAQAPEQVESKDDRPRDPDGKFARKGDDDGAPPAPVEKQEFDGAATLAERRKRQEAETRAAELEKKIHELTQKEREPLDPELIYSDPEAYTKGLTGQFQQALYQQSLNMSERFARSQHGDELVEAAMEWGKQKCGSDPYFNHQVASSGDPVGYAVKEYQRSQIVETVTPEDLAKFREWQQQQQAAPPVAQAAPATPPPTLTGERNIGTRSEPVQTGPATFAEALGRR